MSTPLSYLSICSGIEAASVAWEPLGWRPVGFAEIDKAASRVLAHRWPDIPNFGDFTRIDLRSLGRVDVLVGGTPCQGFSRAGKRQSLSDPRSNLALAYAVLAHELVRHAGLRNAVWENVPGVLSMDDNAFGCFLGALVGADDALLPSLKPSGRRGNDFWAWRPKLGRLVPIWPDAGMVAGPRARIAWRVFDAQYFGVAQRRNRVFLVADFGGGADPAAVLFERQGLRGNSAPRAQTREGIAGPLGSCTDGGGVRTTDIDGAGALICMAHGQAGAEIALDHSPTLNCNHEQPIIAFPERMSGPQYSATENLAPALGALNPTAIAFDTTQITSPDNGGGRRQEMNIATRWAVRRLTPVECERLQGFPDGHTAIPKAADSPRYKQLGNSMAVPCVRWIGERMDRRLRSQHHHKDSPV